MSKGAGAPSKYKAEYCERLREHMRKGFSFQSFAGLVGVCRDTLYEWRDTHKEFHQAKAEATELARLFWEELGINYVINVSEFEQDGDTKKKTSSSKSLNSAVWIYNMKVRFPDEWDPKPDQALNQDQSITPQTVAALGEFAEKATQFLARGQKK